MSTSQQRIMRAKFRNLKLRALGEPQVVTCELEVELRAARADPQRFFLHWKFSGRQIYSRAYTLVKAQHVARSLFEEQLEPWEWVHGEQRCE